MPPLLSCHDLTVSVPGRTLVADLNLEIAAGECVGILGANGAGKTLTLHTLAGLRAPAGGSVMLGDRDLSSLSRRDIAKRLGLLLQSVADPFPATVLDAALTGRHPHIDFWRWESADDIDIVREALADVGLAEMEQRVISTLSGGERRRVSVACILAQNPEIFLLDEPTNHLDPHHQVALLDTFRQRVDQGQSALVALHDMNLATRCCDRVLLLFGNGEWISGEVNDEMTGPALSRLYQTEIEAVPWRNGNIFVNV